MEAFEMRWQSNVVLDNYSFSRLKFHFEDYILFMYMYTCSAGNKRITFDHVSVIGYRLKYK